MNENLIPKLILKKTILLSGPTSASIKKVFGTYLTSNFEFISKPGLARLENLNQFLLYPFRINNSGQVEELIDYEIQWQSIPNLLLDKNGATFSNSSVLSSGDWYKIAVTQTGIYKINKDFDVPSMKIFGINQKNFEEELKNMATDAENSGAPNLNPRVPSVNEMVDLYRQAWRAF